MEKTEQEKFLEDLGIQQEQPNDPLTQPLVPEDPAQGEKEEDEAGDEGEDGVKPRNRRERRLLEKLSAERESSIFTAGKLAAMTEAKAASSEEADYLKAIEHIYGNATPEAMQATELLKKAITGARDDAETRAYERVRDERQREMAEEREASNELDQMVEDIEDDHDVTLTDPQRRSFYQLLEKMSPKDQEGNVKEYADPDAVWDVFQEKMKRRPASNPAKDLSSRSMVQSGSSKESTLPDDATQRFLRDNGII